MAKSRKKLSDAWILSELLECRRDPWYFIKTYCYTLDEHAEKKGLPSIRLFPDLEYAEKIVRDWQKGHRKYILDKSRQMLVSWLFSCLHLHAALFGYGIRIFYVSRKAEVSNALLERTKHTLRHLPAWMIPEYRDVEYILEFPGQKSIIQAVSQDNDALRSYTASYIWFDEWAFQENGKVGYAAAKPTIDGGGRVTGTSTPNGRADNLFYALVSDDGERKLVSGSPGSGGIEFRTNANGFRLCRLHYSADPDKDPARDGAEWYRQAVEGTPEDNWQQEYELSYDKREGKPVYGGFSRDTHVKPLIYRPGQIVYRAWDYGYHHPCCVFAQKVPETGQLAVLAALMGEDTQIRDFAKQVLTYQADRFPKADYQDVCDAAGNHKSDKSELTSVEILNSLGIYPAWMNEGITPGIDLIRDLLLMHKGLPRLIFADSNDCSLMVDMMAGGYRYPLVQGDMAEKPLPLKDGYYEHTADCLRYLVTWLYWVVMPKKEEAPPPDKNTAAHVMAHSRKSAQKRKRGAGSPIGGGW